MKKIIIFMVICAVVITMTGCDKIYTEYELIENLNINITEQLEDISIQIGTIQKELAANAEKINQLQEQIIKLQEALSLQVVANQDEAEIKSFTVENDHYIYYVKDGDTLGDIAKIFGVDPDVLGARNNIYDATKLPVGYKLIIPKD